MHCVHDSCFLIIFSLAPRIFRALKTFHFCLHSTMLKLKTTIFFRCRLLYFSCLLVGNNKIYEYFVRISEDRTSVTVCILCICLLPLLLLILLLNAPYLVPDSEQDFHFCCHSYTVTVVQQRLDKIL